jgi:hypothetical protein
MFKKIFFAIVFQGSAMLFTLCSVEGYAQEGVIKIHITDSLKGEALEAANVVVESGGVIAGTGMTDEKGNFVFKNLSAGTYDVKAMLTGYPKSVTTGVLVKNNEITRLDLTLSSAYVGPDVVINVWEKPLVPVENEVKITYTATEIGRSPLNPIELLNSSAVQRDGMAPSFRGARPDANVYIIDGQRVIGSLGLPHSAIEQMSVTLGGVPAMYGDGTGAFIEIETKSGLVHHKK